MWTIFRKEVSALLDSLMAYVVMSAFLSSMGLLLWFFPESSFFEYGYAEMSAFFRLAPYVLMFLIPGITMRSYAEEHRTGTLELLLTAPVSLAELVLGKWLGSVALLVLCLLPTLLYYFSLHSLGYPVGNIDGAEVVGSYLGLLLLGTSFCSIGQLGSVCTKNQLVAFVVSSFACFVLYFGLEAVADLDVWGEVGRYARLLSFSTHYDALGRGLIDLQEVVFFIGCTSFFLLLTLCLLSTLMNWRKGHWVGFGLRASNLILVVVIAEMWLYRYPLRVDVTQDKRYTLSEATRRQLALLEDPIYVEAYLEGELPSGFRRLRKRLEEMIDLMSRFTSSGIELRFVDPMQSSDPMQQQAYIRLLSEQGIQPTNLSYKKKGQQIERLIFPGLLLSYQGRETGLMLLKGSRQLGPEGILNQSIEGIEYQLLSGIRKLYDPSPRRLGMLRGYDRIDSLTIRALRSTLRAEGYYSEEIWLDDPHNRLDHLPLLMVLKPEASLSRSDRYRIDQYLMSGGQLMLFIDGMKVEMDSVSEEGTVAIASETGFEELLFHYGLRLEPKLLSDFYSAQYPVISGQIGGQPQMRLLKWPFFPVIHQKSAHPLSRNLEALLLRYASPLDTVYAKGIRKTPLLYSSARSQLHGSPTVVSLNQLKNPSPASAYRSGPQVMGYLLEGAFSSAFRNRPPLLGSSTAFLSNGKKTKVIVVGDGDFVLGMPHPRSGTIMEIGMYLPEQTLYGNKDFLLQALDYLYDDSGAILTRSRSIALRPLDAERTEKERRFWQMVNLLGPLLIITLLGLLRWAWRRRKYA